jgi:hypothetical protein
VSNCVTTLTHNGGRARTPAGPQRRPGHTSQGRALSQVFRDEEVEAAGGNRLAANTPSAAVFGQRPALPGPCYGVASTVNRLWRTQRPQLGRTAPHERAIRQPKGEPSLCTKKQSWP